MRNSMLCPKCKKEIADGSIFCNHCGAKLKKEEKSGSKASDTLLLIYAIGIVTLSLIQIALTKAIPDWYSKAGLYYFYKFTNFLYDLLMVLPAFAIKKKSIKIVAAILIGLLITYYIVINIIDIINWNSYY